MKKLINFDYFIFFIFFGKVVYKSLVWESSSVRKTPGLQRIKTELIIINAAFYMIYNKNKN